MHTLKLGNIEIPIPGTWNELTAGQLISLANELHPGITIEELKTKLLFVFTGISVLVKPSVTVDNKEYFWIRCKKRNVLVSALSISVITDPFLQFFKEENGQYIVYPQLTKQLLPVLKKKYFGPADGLSNLTFAEFIHAETAYSNYVKSNDQSHLQTLVGILYRPAGKNKPGDIAFDGDVREPFNDFLIQKYSDKLKSITNAERKAILWYFEGCKLHIASLFPFVFKKTPGTGSNGNTFRSFLNVVDELANNNPSEVERIMKVQLYAALNSLNQRIEKSIKHE